MTLLRALLYWLLISAIVFVCFLAAYHSPDGVAERAESTRLNTIQQHLQERAQRRTDALEKCLQDYGPGAAFNEYPDGTWACSDHRTGKIAHKLL